MNQVYNQGYNVGMQQSPVVPSFIFKMADIPSYVVASVTMPVRDAIAGNPSSMIFVRLIDAVDERLPKKLEKLFNSATRFGTCELSILDRDGNTTEAWFFRECAVTYVDYGTLSYRSTAPNEIVVGISYDSYEVI